MRSIFAAEASCSTGSTLLHLLHHVVGAIPLQLFLDLDSDETNGVVLQRDRNRHVLQLPSGRRGQHRQLSPGCQRHVGEGRTPFGLQQVAGNRLWCLWWRLLRSPLITPSATVH